MWPSPFGAHSWHPQSYNPNTGLVYLPTIDMPGVFKDKDIDLKNWQSPHFRFDPAATMVVHRDECELYLQRHTLGPDTVGMIERIDPITLEVIVSSGELPAGPTWPGGIAVAADGFILQTYGRWAHRLDPHSLEVVAARELPRNRPYNSFVLLDDGTMVTKDFGKDSDEPTGIVALDPVTLEPRAEEFVLPERSIARLSADGDTLYVVGTEHIFRLNWDGGWTLDTAFDGLYRTIEGQTYGWDAVIASGAAWFLDDGEGTEGFMAKGSFRTNGASPAPLHLVRADLRDGSVTLHEICGAPMGIVALVKAAGLAPSGSEANRLIDGGGVRIDGQQVSDKGLKLDAGQYVLQVGKRKFVRIHLS